MAGRQENALLAVLSEQDCRQTLSGAQRLSLAAGTVLYQAGDTLTHAYFPVSGLIALLATTEDGSMLQVAVTDRRGFVGVPLVLRQDETPYQVVVQASGEAYRMPARTLRTECQRVTALQDATLRCADAHLVEVGQAAVCHRFHSVLQRLCRWLLAYARGAQSDTVVLTQEQWGQVLGVPRAAISRAAGVLQEHAIIRQRHGRMQILNRGGLYSHACACAAPLKLVH